MVTIIEIYSVKPAEEDPHTARLSEMQARPRCADVPGLAQGFIPGWVVQDQLDCKAEGAGCACELCDGTVGTNFKTLGESHTGPTLPF